MGVTTIGFMNASLGSLRSLLELWFSGRLCGRVRVYLNPECLGLLRRLGVRAGFGDSWLRIMGVKVLCDGSFGAYTAYLREPYSDRVGWRGVLVTKPNKLEEIARGCVESGLQLALHSIGDGSLDMIIRVLSRFDRGVVRRLRFRIEHLSLAWDDQIEWISSYGLPVVVQPMFTVSDSSMIYSRLGEERVRYTYRFKTLVDNGVVIGLSSDAPVENPDPWKTIYAAVTRGEYEEDRWARRYARDTAIEKLSIIEALHYYTYGSAYSLHSEDEVGKLEPGYYADIIVVDRDPLELEPSELKKLTTRHVFIGGKQVK